MAAPTPSHAGLAVVTLTTAELRAEIRAALEPLRVELERLRGERAPELVSLPEAARRLGVDVRTVQRWLREHRNGLEEEWIGGARMVRLPAGIPRE